MKIYKLLVLSIITSFFGSCVVDEHEYRHRHEHEYVKEKVYVGAANNSDIDETKSVAGQ